MSDLTLEQLNEKVDSLTKVVEKQSALISKTGQQLIEIQVKNVKNKMSQMDTKQPDLSDYVLNEDIVQLVGELQSQLDSLEDRTIARIFNSKLGAKEGKIAPLSNKDGELPTFDFYPQNIDDFTKLKAEEILSLCEFYELIVPNDESLQQFLNDEKLQTLEEASNLIDNKTKPEDLSDDEIKDLHDELARYLGLVYRNNKDAW